MLPPRHRLTEPQAFARLTRGPRAGSPLLVMHARPRLDGESRTSPPALPRVGFAVARSVGNAVTRNRVKRRLRAIMATQVTTLPPGVDVLVRANPAAAEAPYAQLKAEVTRLTNRLMPAPRRHSIIPAVSSTRAARLAETGPSDAAADGRRLRSRPQPSQGREQRV